MSIRGRREKKKKGGGENMFYNLEKLISLVALL